MKPIVWSLNALANIIAKSLGYDSLNEQGDIHSEQN